MVYGVFDGEYSDWGVRGYFPTREEAEKYCCIHTDCYIRKMKDLSSEEDLSDVVVYYEQEIIFEFECGGKQVHMIEGKPSPWTDFTTFTKTKNMRDEPDRYNYYTANDLRPDHIEYNFNHGWISFHINTVRANDRKHCEKIAQDYLAKLYGDKGFITKEDIDAMNERFREVMY